MTNNSATTPDWQEWLRRWDTMQTAYLPFREERFTIMLDAVEALVGQEFVALDLASGPGAISQRLLARFPHAHSVAVDYDPSLLALGQGALGTQDGRLRWVEADLRDPAWVERLGEERVDAVLSTTALHWLDAGTLARLYQQLGQLVRPGGVFLNGDHMRFPPHMPSLQTVVEYVTRRQRDIGPDGRGENHWRRWWSDFAQQPGMAPLVAERDRRFSEHTADEDTAPIAEFHAAALRNAGFREVGLIWRQPDDGVLLAVR